MCLGENCLIGMASPKSTRAPSDTESLRLICRLAELGSAMRQVPPLALLQILAVGGMEVATHFDPLRTLARSMRGSPNVDHRAPRRSAAVAHFSSPNLDGDQISELGRDIGHAVFCRAESVARREQGTFLV